ncbi:MAG: methionyl-tRNA formyltransferase [Candidatus Izemoplasmatales bacterium]|nr:methionyl-tRNA formyltransferase [Candidatus Izemoplasmatales bacterium]
MKIVFMGTMDFAVPILFGLQERHEVSLVVTQPDKPIGRKQLMKASSVKICAQSLNIPVFQPKSIKSDYLPILNAKPELIVVAAYGQMIPKEVLFFPKRESINVHASLLPKYRGGAPMQRAIMAGDKETGVTVMKMAQKMDSGPILAQARLPIEVDDNVETLEGKLALLGRNLLLKTLDELQEDKAVLIPQNEEEVTYARNLLPEEEKIDFNNPALTIYNHIRAFYPKPVAHGLIEGQKLKILKADAIQDDHSVEAFPGEIVSVDKGNVHIMTGSGLIRLVKVQLEGRNAMSIEAFMNGIGKSLLVKGRKFK